jgi:hypothetical protein
MQLRGTGVLDNSEIKLKCPRCQWDLTLRLGDVRRASDVKCLSCGSGIAIKSSLDAVLEELDGATGGLPASTKGTQT